MATRSGIGFLEANHSVSGIYCHWDGGPEHVGRILATHYTAPAKIRTLIEGGALSSLGPDIGEKHAFSDYRPEWCTYYRRDRGDTGGAPVHVQTPDAFYTWAKTAGAEFVYVFAGDRWRFVKAVQGTARTEIDLWDEVAETLTALAGSKNHDA